ncbi:MAG: 50S ribosome-binding GTPase [Phycisphaerales bacterium]|nr:MAG: 50S ribosome-binding GTPase [Phycisphaerales bacterium]
MRETTYGLDDTIAAVSSAFPGARTIVRLSGPEAFAICGRMFRWSAAADKGEVVCGRVVVDFDLSAGGRLYLFKGPHSYTGDDVAEIHVDASAAVVEALVSNLLEMGVRGAGPGEFTARAYLNGRIDLAQAEAVNEIIVSSNAFQLVAAEKLLSGHLSRATVEARSAMMEYLSLIEAGLDFSGEDIELLTRSGAVEGLGRVKGQLEELLAGSISYESVIDLPAVGIAGAPNAGKSSLLNRLLGSERSIVSGDRKTTRDILSGPLSLAHGKCVLFDCAGLVLEPDGILDELARQAAVEALRNSSVVLFCVDASKAEWAEDISVRGLLEPKVLVPVATKCDLLSKGALATQLAKLRESFGADLTATSAKTGAGIETVRDEIDRQMLNIESSTSSLRAQGSAFSEGGQDWVALTARHRRAVTEAIENICECVREVKAGNDEVAAMTLRAAYQAVSDIEQQPVDDRLLERIFKNFCVGK